MILNNRITLSKAQIANVDDSDFSYLNSFRWHVTSNGYARRAEKTCSGAYKYIYMHRELIKDSKTVDHLDGNRLNNCRANLRGATYSENGRNRKSVRGITWDSSRGKWSAKISINYTTINLGRFLTEDEAILARIAAEQKYFSEFAPRREDG